MAHSSRNPMQSAVILSMNSTILAILEGPKDSVRKFKHDFIAARTFENWMPVSMMSGTCKNLTNGITWAFKRTKGAINLTLGAPLTNVAMMELHSEFLMHFHAIFTMEVTNYY
jgi:hypothetical protein